jgi:hypothetical protein
MSETTAEFDFLVIQPDEATQIPFNPHIEIVLSNRFRFTASDELHKRLSGHLMTEGEIDERIQTLKNGLDTLGERAKLALLRAQSETLAMVTKKQRGA